MLKQASVDLRICHQTICGLIVDLLMRVNLSDFSSRTQGSDRTLKHKFIFPIKVCLIELVNIGGKKEL